MKRILPASALAALFLLFSCSVQEPETVPQNDLTAAEETFLPGKATVLLSEEAVLSVSTKGCFPEGTGSIEILHAERVFPDAGEFEERHRAAGLHRWYRVEYDRNIPSTKAQEELGALPGVEAVDIPRRKAHRAYFNDEFIDRQWNLYNDGTLGSNFIDGFDINVVPVWQEFTTGSSEVVVAVVDGGIDLSHEDLSGVTLPAGEGGSRNFVTGDSPTRIPADEHGTHVAGIIGAVNGNGIGVAGIAGGSDGNGGVRLMSCAIFAETDSEESSGEEEAEALVWAADHGAVIANNSWGYVFSDEREAKKGAQEFQNNPSATKSAIDYFIDNAGMDARGNQTGPMKGGVVFFACGNDGWAYDAPSSYDRVIAVGAFGPDGKMPKFSNYGTWVDILAPGGSDSAYDYEEWILSSVPDTDPEYEPYAYMSGTSMACPHAAGVAALLVSHFGGSGFTNEDLKEKLLGGAKSGIIDLQGRTSTDAMLDAYGALTYGSSPDPGKPDIQFSTDYTGDFNFKSHESVSITWRIDGNARTRLPVTFVSDCPGVTTSCNISQAQLSLNALKADPGDYTATIRVGDAATKTIAFTILENHAPQLLSPIDAQVVNAASASLVSIDLNGHFQDPDGETLNYDVALSDGNIVTWRISNGVLSFTPEGYGQTEVTVTATDARKAACSADFPILARNAYQDLDIYPNPVSDYLYIRPADTAATSATLYSRSGAQVLSQNGEAGLFQPLRLDVRELSAGTYTLQVNYGGKVKTQNIVKL
ncbi:MAG: S8 family serine peptidase [Bacteroidales bacterium]|nr:S8 family serine peptidase [Bacteroidales bacterium]